MREESIVSFFFGILCGAVIVFLIMIEISIPKSTLIKHGYGEYNCTTGKFQLKKGH